MRDMPLMRGAVELVVGLRKLGYLGGIVTDSYLPAPIQAKINETNLPHLTTVLSRNIDWR